MSNYKEHSESNPIEEWEKAALATQTRGEKDIEMWKRWKESQSPQHLEPLINAFAPTLNKVMQQHRAPDVSPSGMKAEGHKIMIKAFETYDPSRGAALATHVTGRLIQLYRYNQLNQNLAKIPEQKTRQLGAILRAQSSLRSDLERDPTPEELAEHTGLSQKRINNVLSRVRKGIPNSSFESDVVHKSMERPFEVMALMPYSLTPDQNQVFNHMYGLNGAPKIDKTNHLAKTLGKTPSQISKIKKIINNKFNAAMQPANADDE